MLQATVEKSEEFTAFVDELIFGDRRGPAAVAAVVGIVITSLTEAGVNIWKAWQDSSRQEREHMIKELEKLKWQPFNKII
jgi:hypothetical protein